MRRTRVFSMIAAVAAMLLILAPGKMKAGQSGFTLTGSWAVTSQPINGAVASRMGNTLGFPLRNMIFADDGGIRTGLVDREDAGPNVKPLGVWRIEGNYLSAAFELWCPDPTADCGSVVMRGTFSDPDTIDGTMTVFFETPDNSTPTGLDTWVFSYHGVRTSGSAN